MKVVSIVGARPQFIKAAAISRAIRENNVDGTPPVHEVIVHTGQHYDTNMSQVFFDELDIPFPEYNLWVGSASHGAMTGRMLEKIEDVILTEKPDWVLVYGDTNSTLAGALAAVKLHIPVAHVEAGLRSFNMRMPEEINRILTDRISTLLFCPTETAVKNLQKEGLTNITNGGKLTKASFSLSPTTCSSSLVINVGDVMYDVSLFYRERAREKSNILEKLGLEDKNYVLATCHRAENTDDPIRLRRILEGLGRIAQKVLLVMPLHPRTQKQVKAFGLSALLADIRVVDPVSYLDIVRLEQSAKAIVTDSGGMQKEAYFYGVPCITIRQETEWVETVEAGWNQLVGSDPNAIVLAFDQAENQIGRNSRPYGNGQTAETIVAVLMASCRF